MFVRFLISSGYTSRRMSYTHPLSLGVLERRGWLRGRATHRYGIAKTVSYRNAIEPLRDAGEIVAADTPTKWRLVDPLFSLWVRNGHAWPVSPRY